MSSSDQCHSSRSPAKNTPAQRKRDSRSIVCGAGFPPRSNQAHAARNGSASAPDERPLDMTGLARSLWPEGFTDPWRFVQDEARLPVDVDPRNGKVLRTNAYDTGAAWENLALQATVSGLVAHGMQRDRQHGADFAPGTDSSSPAATM